MRDSRGPPQRQKRRESRKRAGERREQRGNSFFIAVNVVFFFLSFFLSFFSLFLSSSLSSHPTPTPTSQLKSAIADIASQPGACAPSSVRFFRGAMQNIITRALTESGIKPLPSRRCFALFEELERRRVEVYPKMPGFSATAPPPFGALDAAAFGGAGGAGGGGAPAQLPDALRGEAWAFVQLPLEELAPELDAVRRGDVFGAVFDVVDGKDASLPSSGTPIPGTKEEMWEREGERREREARRRRGREEII